MPNEIHFPSCTIFWEPEHKRAVVRFHDDNSEAHACPHHTPEYFKHAREKSTGSVVMYCWQHEIAHIIVGLINGGPSVVLWNVAHGLPTDTLECEEEEKAAQDFQRRFFLRES